MNEPRMMGITGAKARKALLKGLAPDEVNVVFRLLAEAGFAIVPVEPTERIVVWMPLAVTALFFLLLCASYMWP